MEVHRDALGDYACEHGVALDVHCCGCHSGFIFDPSHVCGETVANQERHMPMSEFELNDHRATMYAAVTTLCQTLTTLLQMAMSALGEELAKRGGPGVK